MLTSLPPFSIQFQPPSPRSPPPPIAWKLLSFEGLRDWEEQEANPSSAPYPQGLWPQLEGVGWKGG